MKHTDHSMNLKLSAFSLASACALGLAMPASPAWAAPSGCARVDVAPIVKVSLGKSTIVRPPVAIQRIVLGSGGAPRQANDAAAASGVADLDVMLLSPSEVYLMGRTLGSTNVILMDKAGVCTAFDVVVGMDAVGLHSLIQELLPNEKGVKVTTAHDSVVLSGEVSDNDALSRITDLAQAFASRGGQGEPGSRSSKVINMLSVAAPQQVMLEVKVAEISKTLLDEFGIDVSSVFVDGKGTRLQSLMGLFGGAPLATSVISGTGVGVRNSSAGVVVGGNIATTGATGGNVTSQPMFDSSGRFLYNQYTTTYGTVPGKAVHTVNLNMQKTDGLVKVLAEPNIMAISGQTGSFLAGGKILIPVSQSNISGTRDITLEEKEFGVSVRFTPTVLGGGRINLHVRPEVSELSASGVTISGMTGSSVLPSFTSRKAETTVQLADGQSFAIGGLVKNNASTSIAAFPFLGELPILGALFRSSQFQTDRTELVFVITPRIVKPLPANYRLPTDSYVEPTREDVILHGRTEGRGGINHDGAARTPPAPQAPGGFDVPAKEKP